MPSLMLKLLLLLHLARLKTDLIDLMLRLLGGAHTNLGRDGRRDLRYLMV